MRTLIVGFALIFVTASGAAQSQPVTLWVTLGDSDQLLEVDAYAFKEIRRITTDPRPHGLAASADGSKIYIGSDRTGNFQVIDARTGTISGQIALGKDPILRSVFGRRMPTIAQSAKVGEPRCGLSFGWQANEEGSVKERQDLPLGSSANPEEIATHG